MKVKYFCCTPNNNKTYLQPRYGVIHRNISELLTLLRSFPLNYIIYENEIASKDENYYIVYDIYMGGVFYIYLNEPIRFVVLYILKCIDTSNFPIRKFSKCFFTLQIIIIIKIKNMEVDIFSFEFVINFYTFGTKLQSTAYKTSDASFSLLKK